MQGLTSRERAIMINRISAKCFAQEYYKSCADCPMKNYDCGIDMFSTDYHIKRMYDILRHPVLCKDPTLQYKLIKKIDDFCYLMRGGKGCKDGDCPLRGKDCFSTDLDDLKELYDIIHKKESKSNDSKM